MNHDTVSARFDVITNKVDALSAGYGIVVLRWTAAMLWLSNVNWKVPPDFGKSGDSCGSLCRYVGDGIEHPVLPGSAAVFEHLVQPNLVAFGWITLVTECALAALLISGRFVRSTSVLGVVLSFGIFASVANADGEWYWSYILMMAISFALLVLAPQAKPASVRNMGILVVGYGIVMAIAHWGTGFTGDGNNEWKLFGSSTDIPGDFGRNVFAGSIALGLISIVIGAAVAGVSLSGAWQKLDQTLRNGAGWALVAIGTLLMFTYNDRELAIGMGSKVTFCCVLAGLGLALAAPAHADNREATDGTS